ncbi:Arfgap domain of Hiv-1 Rev binding protein [Cladochytrium replicatum]|nr:Arfgap domain of Hiv-1 Rev binding protein [Cladochytrium replicatum]
MSTKKQEERHLKILKELMQKEENKVCFDCAKRTPVFVNITATTFICTSCSGIVREFSHRVKSVSASIFTPAEIQSLQKGGNSYARRTWLATWNPETYPQPDANDTFGIREFMRVKYVQKRFYKEVFPRYS